ncbi:MAG TPA: type II toxin-antitoxin system VapC family toxin [Bryobacteraceae bacterium]|nr:type II toxin-antitoxin system VapC family toxin [Bryobacteraceae bacterium]
MSRFVLDNTVTMAWCFDDETTPFTETLLSRLSSLTDSAIVPALWLYEVVNVTGLAVRKGRITEDKARAFLDSLGDLPIEIEDAERARLFTSVMALAGRHKLTAYDASYLELAIRHDLPIAALDNALTKAAREAGVTLVQI